MSSPQVVAGRKYNRKRAVGDRYGGVCTRTVDRWTKSGILPPPDLIQNGRPLWAEETLDRHDRQAVVARAGAKGLPAETAPTVAEEATVAATVPSVATDSAECSQPEPRPRKRAQQLPERRPAG